MINVDDVIRDNRAAFAVAAALESALGGDVILGVSKPRTEALRPEFLPDGGGRTASAPSADGAVRTTLRGSSIPATFRVRATASGAAPAFLAVGVSATGFGNVLAGVEDLSGTGPARLRVEAYPSAGCDHPSVAEGRFGRAITLLPGETLRLRRLGQPPQQATRTPAVASARGAIGPVA